MRSRNAAKSSLLSSSAPPLTWIDRYGADLLRKYTLSHATSLAGLSVTSNPRESTRIKTVIVRDGASGICHCELDDCASKAGRTAGWDCCQGLHHTRIPTAMSEISPLTRTLQWKFPGGAAHAYSDKQCDPRTARAALRFHYGRVAAGGTWLAANRALVLKNPLTRQDRVSNMHSCAFGMRHLARVALSVSSAPRLDW